MRAGVRNGRPDVGLTLAVALAGALTTIAVYAGGATILGETSRVEIAVTVCSAAVVAAALLRGPAPARAAIVAGASLWALAALAAASLAWSAAPADSWLEANRLFAYASLFGAAIAGGRALASHWRSVLAALLVAGSAICLYALATKVFPATFDANDPYARLRAPYDYWNAVGLSAAMTVIPCLWLASRREGRPLITALAYPVAGLALTVLMLSYSRGGLVALVIGVTVWFVLVPRRLRSAAVLIAAATAAAAVVAWAFAQGALTHDRVDLALRTQSGHDLGLLVAAVLALLTCTGLVVGFLAARRAPTQRRRDQAGVVLVVALAILPAGVAGGLAVSSRGFTGSISHSFNKLTDPHAKTPPNTPGRLTAVASVRAQYWNEALQVFQSRPVSGVGAGGYVVARERYRYGNLTVRHAHGFVVQTLADLGLAGLALSLLTLLWWWRAARPALDVADPERAGLVCMLACVAAFGAHSTIDWTWAIPGNACLALTCAGWLAGRPRGEAWKRRAPGQPDAPVWNLPVLGAVPAVRAMWAGAVVALALALSWSQWQPLRAARAADDALLATARHDLPAARAGARRAARINPVAVDPLFELASIDISAGDGAGAADALQTAVRRQPANAQTWLALANFELNQLHAPRQALAHLQPALYLDPHNADVIDAFLTATRTSG